MYITIKKTPLHTIAYFKAECGRAIDAKILDNDTDLDKFKRDCGRFLPVEEETYNDVENYEE